jgi:RimJ/RimL family protein N-acetyltransferase
MSNFYSVLKSNIFSEGAYTIVPIRDQDKYDIMRWRNEQIYHLRQSKPLSQKDQDYYFNEVIAPLFTKEKPDQILFSLLERNVCIGYGGLVHINWNDLNAEISFVMNTQFEDKMFEELWKSFLILLENVAFTDIGLHKIYTYAYDLRPRLFKTLEESGYTKEAILKEHCLISGVYLDVIIHSKIKH